MYRVRGKLIWDYKRRCHSRMSREHFHQQKSRTSSVWQVGKRDENGPFEGVVRQREMG